MLYYIDLDTEECHCGYTPANLTMRLEHYYESNHIEPGMTRVVIYPEARKAAQALLGTTYDRQFKGGDKARQQLIADLQFYREMIEGPDYLSPYDQTFDPMVMQTVVEWSAMDPESPKHALIPTEQQFCFTQAPKQFFLAMSGRNIRLVYRVEGSSCFTDALATGELLLWRLPKGMTGAALREFVLDHRTYFERLYTGHSVHHHAIHGDMYRLSPTGRFCFEYIEIRLRSAGLLPRPTSTGLDLKSLVGQRK